MTWLCMTDKEDDHSTMTQKSKKQCVLHFVIFDEDDAGDGSDNMLEGDKRGKKGEAIWRATSVQSYMMHIF